MLSSTPTPQQTGTTLQVHVTDGRGLSSQEQSIPIAVMTEMVNSPPTITSNPGVIGTVNVLYAYNATVPFAETRARI